MADHRNNSGRCDECRNQEDNARGLERLAGLIVPPNAGNSLVAAAGTGSPLPLRGSVAITSLRARSGTRFSLPVGGAGLIWSAVAPACEKTLLVDSAA